MKIIGSIHPRQIYQPFGQGWTWTINLRAEDYSWHGAIHRYKGGPYFKSKESAARKALRVAKELGIEIEDAPVQSTT